MKVKVSKNPHKNWKNNAIQFPRLIAEAEALGIWDKYRAELCAEMDLEPVDFIVLIDRAQSEWDQIKARTKCKL